MKATDILREEHQVILRVLDCLAAAVERAERTRNLDVDTIHKVIEFSRGFVDACHHGKEEAQLFPALGINNVSCPPGTQHILLAEHQEGRECVQAMAEQLDAHKKGDNTAADRICILAHRYIEHLSQHIQKEDHCLFPNADAQLSSSDGEALLRGFEEVERREVGAGAHARFLGIADELCRKWKVGSSAQPMQGCSCGH